MLRCYGPGHNLGFRDLHEFDNYPGGRKGKVCKSCLAWYANSPALMRVTGLGYYMAPFNGEPDGIYEIPASTLLIYGNYLKQINKDR